MEEKIAELQAKIAELTNQLTVAQEKANKTEELVAGARKNEKDKLYTEITTLKEQVATSETKLTALTTSLTEKEQVANEAATKTATLEEELAKSKETITALQNDIEGGKGMSQELLDKITKAQEEMQKTIKTQADELAAMKASKEAENLAKEINTYRKGKIKDLDEAFHTLVKGSTKEEIDASFESAKSAHEKLLKKYGVTPAKPSSLGNEVLKKYSPSQIKEMTMEEYAAYRKELGLN